MGRLPWDSPLVLADRNTLLGSDTTARESLINRVRAEMKDQIRKNIVLVERMERSAFLTKSFYYCKEHGITSVPADDFGASLDTA